MQNDTDENNDTMITIFRLIRLVSVPYIIIISVVGVGGNILTILTMRKRSLTRNFNNCTLIALAVTDLVFNFALIFRCIIDHVEFNRDIICRLLSCFSHLAEFLSACFTAQFTAQRFIAVRFPLSVYVAKKIHLVHYFIVGFFIVCGLLYCYALVKNNQYDDCQEELGLIWFVSDAILSFLLPFTLIIVLNLLIIYHLKQGVSIKNSLRSSQQVTFGNYASQIRKYEPSSMESTQTVHILSKSNINGILENRVSSVSPPKRKSNNRRSSSDYESISQTTGFGNRCSSRMKHQSYRVTRMLIIVSTCFLLLNAPAHFSTIAFKIYSIQHQNSVESPQSSSSYSQNSSIHTRHSDSVNHNTKINLFWIQFGYLVVIILQHISYASYSINFFLYSFCGIKFRRDLDQYIVKICRRYQPRSLVSQNPV